MCRIVDHSSPVVPLHMVIDPMYMVDYMVDAMHENMNPMPFDDIITIKLVNSCNMNHLPSVLYYSMYLLGFIIMVCIHTCRI